MSVNSQGLTNDEFAKFTRDIMRGEGIQSGSLFFIFCQTNMLSLGETEFTDK